jgi:CheY-like chemotaxis protein
MASILLVDDDEQFRKMLSEVLRRAGYDVQEACNGNEATRMYRSHRTDLVITDLIMPDKEGLETIREIRQDNPGVRIIAMSGGDRNGNIDYLKVAKTFGAQQVLDKPFTHREILGAVRTLLEESPE